MNLPPTPTQTTIPTIPPGAPCPSTCGWVTYGAYCYYADLAQTLTFNEAREACASFAGGNADLVTIPDVYTNLFLKNMVEEHSTSWVPVWIGLTRSNAGKRHSKRTNSNAIAIIKPDLSMVHGLQLTGSYRLGYHQLQLYFLCPITACVSMTCYNCRYGGCFCRKPHQQRQQFRCRKVAQYIWRPWSHHHKSGPANDLKQ